MSINNLLRKNEYKLPKLFLILSFFIDCLFYKNFITHDKDVQCNIIGCLLTLGGFVFAAQSFLIPFMKDALYENSNYINALKANNPNNWKKGYYKPLENLSDTFTNTATLSFLSAGFFFVFFISNINIINFIAILFGLTSFLSIFHCLYLLNNNIKDTLKYSERKK